MISLSSFHAVRLPSISARNEPPPRGRRCAGSDAYLIGWHSTRPHGAARQADQFAQLAGVRAELRIAVLIVTEEISRARCR